MDILSQALVLSSEKAHSSLVHSFYSNSYWTLLRVRKSGYTKFKTHSWTTKSLFVKREGLLFLLFMCWFIQKYDLSPCSVQNTILGGEQWQQRKQGPWPQGFYLASIRIQNTSLQVPQRGAAQVSIDSQRRVSIPVLKNQEKWHLS